jgi:cobalt-zinc-cadmium efflux system outer membrane protein
MRRALFILAVSGCVVPKKAGFDDVKQSLSTRIDQRVHWYQGTEEDRRVEEETKKLLQAELTVDTAAQIALFNNPQLQATYERLGVAQAEVVQAGLLKNPSLSFHWGFRFGDPGLDEIIGSLTQGFLDLFLMPLKKRLANAEFRRVKLEVADAVLTTVSEVRQGFYTAQAATQIVEMRRMLLDAEQAATELAVRQHEAGNISDLELSNQQAVYAQAKLDLSRAEYQLLADRERLTRLLGVWGASIDYKIAPKLPELPPDEPDLAHLETLAIGHRLDLAASKEELLLASAALQVTKGSRMISGLNVGMNGHRDPDGPKTLGPTIDLELPIFDQKQAEVARLRAQLRAAQHRTDALAIAIRSEVRQARTRLLAARMTIDYFRKTLVPLRERIVALSQEHYNAMLLGVYQLLQAKQNEINSYREYIEAVRDYWIARADLERAIGTRLGMVRRAERAEESPSAAVPREDAHLKGDAK